MNTDIRLSVGFWDHPKTEKTMRRLGFDGVRSLQSLWLWAVQNRPDGVLSGMDWEDVEIAARWHGEEKAFLSFCLGMWIDETEEGYVLHDWEEHNPWQAESAVRSESARKAARARWGKTQQTEKVAEDAPAMRTHASGNADAMRPHASGNAPLLSSPNQTKDTKTKGINALPYPSSPSPSIEVVTEPDPVVDQEAKGSARGEDVPIRTRIPSRGSPDWPAFLSCWQVWPVQQGQDDAWRVWSRMARDGTLSAAWEIRDAIMTLVAEDSRWQEGFVPKFEKWLNGRGWNDKPYIKPDLAPVGAGKALPAANTQRQKQNQEKDLCAMALVEARHAGRTQNIGNNRNSDNALPVGGHLTSANADPGGRLGRGF